MATSTLLLIKRVLVVMVILIPCNVTTSNPTLPSPSPRQLDPTNDKGRTNRISEDVSRVSTLPNVLPNVATKHDADYKPLLQSDRSRGTMTPTSYRLRYPSDLRINEEIIPNYTSTYGDHWSGRNNNVKDAKDREPLISILNNTDATKGIHNNTDATKGIHTRNNTDATDGIGSMGDSDEEHQGEIEDEDVCELQVNLEAVRRFRHIVYFEQLNFVYLKLIPKDNVTINSVKGVVESQYWVWTFYGKDGALQFLKWPIEFGIWSLGLLTEYIKGPLDIEIERVYGDCSNITVGTLKGDKIIAHALVNLSLSLMDMSEEFEEKYGPSFWCYIRRMYIYPQPLYELCKHFFCPVEALEYVCLAYYYTGKSRIVSRTESIFVYDKLWWIVPTVIAVILFAFFPLLLINLCWRVSRRANTVIGKKRYANEQTRTPPTDTADPIIYLDGTYHVTLCNTVFRPVINVAAKSGDSCSRFCRFLTPLLSICIILIQIFCDFVYMPEFLSTCVDKGVPMGFRSMNAGFSNSALNFLPRLNGPFVALGVYLLLTCIFATIPHSLSGLLQTGLPRPEFSQSRFIVHLGLRDIERYGSVPVIGRTGYLKIYSVYLGQFYMLLNVKYWKHCVQLQVSRWYMFATTRTLNILLPVYIIVCILELVMAVLLYGFPIFSFALTVIRAYCNFIHRPNRLTPTSYCRRLFSFILNFLIIIGVAFFLYMFCIIFLDASLFLTRIFIFTYTGIIMYPRSSYGYIIFTLTVIYYLWDCIRKFSLTYQRLLKDTIQTCIRILPANDVQQVVFRKRGLKGVTENLYEHVIETHCPRRKQVFVSLLKLGVILTIIGVSLGLLMKTDRFRELHITMHVGTALFTCALPQIIKSMCSGLDGTFQRIRFKRDIAATVKDYMGYFVDNSEGDQSDGDSVTVAND